MGNPAPLEQKVQRDQQGQPPGGLPKDLEEAIALQKIQEKRNAMQNQQAMQAGGPQPTIVEKLRQLLNPQPQAQAQPPQMAQAAPQGAPQGPPQGMPPQGPPQGMPPPPVQAAHGGHLAQLLSNLGQHYGGGGIVAFATGDKVEGEKSDDDDSSTLGTAAKITGGLMSIPLIKEAATLARTLNISPIQALKSLVTGAPGAVAEGAGVAMTPVGAGVIGGGYAASKQAADVVRNASPEQREQMIGYGADPSGTSLAAAIMNEAKPAQEKAGPTPPGINPLTGQPISREAMEQGVAPMRPQATRADTSKPSPQALALLDAAQKQKRQQASEPQIPGTPYDRMDATRRTDFPQVSEEGQIIQERMRQDPEEKRRAEIARINEMIGKPDNAAILETIAALKAKREKAQANADPLMDLLGGIASAKPGQKWWQSGVAGSEAAANKAAQREAADTAYLEQILGHQQKVADTDRAYKTQLYTASSAVADRAAKEVYDAAIASNKSKEEAAKLAQEERIRVMEMVSREKTNAATNAAHITAANAGRGPTYSDLQKEKLAKDWLERKGNEGKSPLEAMAAVSNMLTGRDIKQGTAQEALQVKREQMMAANPTYSMNYRKMMTETDPVKKKQAADIVEAIELRELGPRQSVASGKVTTPPPGYKLD